MLPHELTSKVLPEHSLLRFKCMFSLMFHLVTKNGRGKRERDISREEGTFFAWFYPVGVKT